MGMAERMPIVITDADAARLLSIPEAIEAMRVAFRDLAEGKAVKSASVRLLRDGTVVWTGKLASLRRFKDDVAEVDEGQECGIVLDGYADIKEGDVLEFFQTKQVEQTLE